MYIAMHYLLEKCLVIMHLALLQLTTNSSMEDVTGMRESGSLMVKKATNLSM